MSGLHHCIITKLQTPHMAHLNVWVEQLQDHLALMFAKV